MPEKKVLSPSMDASLYSLYESIERHSRRDETKKSEQLRNGVVVNNDRNSDPRDSISKIYIRMRNITSNALLASSPRLPSLWSFELNTMQETEGMLNHTIHL